MKKIIVNIDQLGNPKVEAEGFHGAGCEAATAPIEKALASGSGSVERVMKPEWMEQESADQTEHATQW